MAPIPRVKSLKREDYPQAPSWFDQLLLVLNQQAGDVSNALSNGLTQTENGRAEFKVVDVTMPFELPPWRLVGATGQPPFQNGFTNWDATQYTPARFRMQPDGFVSIDGFVKQPSPAVQNVVMFTMPAGYGPRLNARFTALGDSGGVGAAAPIVIQIQSNGDVRVHEGAIRTAGWLGFDGIRFQAHGITARIESFGAPFPLSVRLANKWPVKTCDVVAVFDVTAQQPGTVGGVVPYWQTREAGMLTLEALWGLQPGRSYRVTLLVTAG